MSYFKHRSNPEAVLNKANDTVKLGDKEDAWNIISEYLGSRNKRGWRQAADDMMQVFVKLCVELRKSPKDGFIQYRHHCSTLHLDSLERNLRTLIDLSQQKGEEEYSQLVKEFEGRDRSDPAVKKEFSKRQFGLAYLKYQWSVYRCVLDVLRNNQKLDPLYQETVRCAIRFCVNHERTSEYRKLCDVCRKHLGWIFEHQTPGKNYVEIGTQCILSIYLNTRFDLLENATKLQLWQEAYRLITDIHQLRERSKAELDPKLEKNYYHKLSEIFIGSDNMVLHAYSLIRYFVLLRDEYEREEAGQVIKRKKGEEAPVEEDIKNIAMKCVLAVCATPPPRCRSQTIGPPLDPFEDKFRLMCEKLNFYARPNQENLLKQLQEEDVDDLLNANFARIQQIMLKPHSPLDFCKEVVATMKKIIDSNPELEVYMEPMKKAASRKLVTTVASLYKVISYDRLQEMFFDGWMQSDVEKLLLQLTEDGVIWCRLSHKFGMCNFRAPSRLSRDTFMRTYLANLGQTLGQLKARELRNERDGRREFFDKIRACAKADFEVVEKRLGEAERLSNMNQQTQRFKNFIKRQRVMEEKNAKMSARQQRIKELTTKKQQQAKSKEKEEKALKEAAKAKEKAKNQLKLVSKVLKTGVKSRTKQVTKKLQQILNASVEETSKAAIDALAMDYLTQNVEAQEAQTQEELRRFDYFVRACRIEEIPLIRKKNAEDAAANADDQIKAYEEHVARARGEYDERMKLRKQFATLSQHTQFFFEGFEDRREKQYQSAKAIQLQQKEKHDRARAEQKRKIEEKKRLQQEQNRIEKEKLEAARKAEEAANPNSINSAPVIVQKPVDIPADPPTPMDANELGPPRRNIDGTPIRPRVSRIEKASKPEPSGPDEGTWRVQTKKRPAERRRFINTKKKAEEKAISTTPKQEVNTKAENVEADIRPTAPSTNVLDRNVRPTAVTQSSKKGGWRERQRLRQQGVLDPVAEIRKRDIGPASGGDSSPRLSPGSVRPKAPPTRQIVRPAVRPIRPSPQTAPAPVRPQPQRGARAIRPESGPRPIRPQGQPLRPQAQPVRPLRPQPQTGIRPSANVRPTGVRPVGNNGGVRPNRIIRPAANGLRPPEQRGMRPPASNNSRFRSPNEPTGYRPNRSSPNQQGNAYRPPARRNAPPPQQPAPIRPSRGAARNANNNQPDESSPPFQTVQRRSRKRFMNSNRS